MNYNKLSKNIFDKLQPKLESHNGLIIFAKNRAKFEGWLKVEICEILSNLNEIKNIIPENNRIDITFNNWAIELKTVNTSYKYKNIIQKQRPITKNIKSVIKDIEDLKKNNKFKYKAVLFVVFPVEHNNVKWQKHYKKIEKELRDIKPHGFNFKNNKIPGVIYFGLV